ncbi:MAG TPA: hypothetical protein VJ180_01125 [Pyrinomonadaceae bacterium]|nr:hypothetical protein [Pyrinomonadaceae bacterium]
MNCQNFEGVINDLAREQIVETSIRDNTLEHCRVCASCAENLADQRALTIALRSLANESQSVEAPPAVPESLTLAIRIRTATTDLIPTNYRWRYWAGALAAMLLVSFAFGAARWRAVRQHAEISKGSAPQKVFTGPKPAETQAANALTLAPPEVRENPTDRKVRRTNLQPGKLRPAARVSKAAQVRNATVTGNFGSEIATEFLPLGYGNALGLQDGGQIVRVEVPRSTLGSFGLPVNMDRAGQRVKADLLLGVDGSARAIRFVQ